LRSSTYDLASIAKARDAGGRRAESPERFFLPGRSNPVILDQQSPVVHLLARIRDEAHRFAVTYQRQKRTKGTLRTSLMRIEGVGPERARRLLRTFGSVARIREASLDELTQVPGISESLAGAIRDGLQNGANEAERSS
jgi:excinuclease ABC subunit C